MLNNNNFNPNIKNWLLLKQKTTPATAYCTECGRKVGSVKWTYCDKCKKMICIDCRGGLRMLPYECKNCKTNFNNWLNSNNNQNNNIENEMKTAEYLYKKGYVKLANALIEQIFKKITT